MARICMVLHNFEPPYGGPELQALKLATRLTGRGHQVLFLAKGSGKAPVHEQVEGIEIFRLNRPGLASVEAFFQLRRLKDKFDILHVHGVGRLASVAVSFARKHGKNVCIKVTTAGHLMKPIPSGWRGFFKRLLQPLRQRKVEVLKQADAMIAISNEIKGELLQHGFLESKIAWIPNGVDTRLFHPVLPEEKAVLREKLGLPQDKRLVVFTGKITRRKGIDTLLKAWSKLSPAIMEQAVLILVGSGHGHADSLETWLDTFIMDQELGSSVIRTGDVNNVQEYLAASDIFAFPSRREGLPNSLLEAMASGLVCVASDIGGNADLIDQGKTGICVPVDDIQAWSGALSQAILPPGQHLADAACLRIQSDYSIAVTVERLEELYKMMRKENTLG